MDDVKRAAILAFIESLFPVILILGLVNLTAAEIGIIMLAIGNGLTLAALIFKKGQEPGPA